MACLSGRSRIASKYLVNFTQGLAGDYSIEQEIGPSIMLAGEKTVVRPLFSCFVETPSEELFGEVGHCDGDKGGEHPGELVELRLEFRLQHFELVVEMVACDQIRLRLGHHAHHSLGLLLVEAGRPQFADEFVSIESDCAHAAHCSTNRAGKHRRNGEGETVACPLFPSCFPYFRFRKNS